MSLGEMFWRADLCQSDWKTGSRTSSFTWKHLEYHPDAVFRVIVGYRMFSFLSRILCLLCIQICKRYVADEGKKQREEQTPQQ